MLELAIAAIGIGYAYHRIQKNKKQIKEYEWTIVSHRSLLRDYDEINCFAKAKGFTGACDFFYYLTENHDRRFGNLARFINKVRYVRNDIAHNGAVYAIDDGFLEKLNACKYVCDVYRRIPSGYKMRLGRN